MKKNHVGRFIGFLIVYAVLAFPLSGLANICGDIDMAGVSSSNILRLGLPLLHCISTKTALILALLIHQLPMSSN